MLRTILIIATLLAAPSLAQAACNPPNWQPGMGPQLDASGNQCVTIGGSGGGGTTPVIPPTTHGKAYLVLTANTSTALTSATPASWSGSLAFPLGTQAITIQSASFNTVSAWLCLGGGACTVATLGSPAAEDEIQAGAAINESVSATQSTSPTIIASASGLYVISW